MDNVKSVIPTIPVNDQDRADNFYKDVLGLKESDKEMPGGTVVVGPGDASLFLYKTDVARGENTVLTFGRKECIF